MRDQHILHVVLGERQPELLQVFRITTQQCRLAPVEFRAEYEAIQAVVFRFAGEDFHEALFETFRRRLDVEIRTGLVAQVEDLYPERLAALQRQFVGVFGVNLEAHAFEDRQRFRQCERFVGAEDHEMQEPGCGVRGPVQLHGTGGARHQHAVDGAYVAAGILRLGLGLVTGREDVAVDPEQLVALVVAERVEHLGAQLVRPAHDHLAELGLDLLDADPRALARRRSHDGVQACERRIGDLDAGIDGRALESVFQYLLDALANGRRITLARHEHDA